MDKFRQISTELWPLIDVINLFSLSIFGISLPIFFKLCMKRSSFKMIFFALKISRGGVCCMSAALLLKSYLISEIEKKIEVFFFNSYFEYLNKKNDILF